MASATFTSAAWLLVMANYMKKTSLKTFPSLFLSVDCLVLSLSLTLSSLPFLYCSGIFLENAIFLYRTGEFLNSVRHFLPDKRPLARYFSAWRMMHHIYHGVCEISLWYLNLVRTRGHPLFKKLYPWQEYIRILLILQIIILVNWERSYCIQTV